MSSPRFEVVTDTSERNARRVLTRLEQIREAFSDTAPSFSGPQIPVRVFVFSAERDYNQFRPARMVTGFFQSGPEMDYLVALDSADLIRVISHEYTHLALNHGAPRLPSWLEEGLAEFYSTVQVGTRELIVGEPIPVHLNLLKSGRWLRSDELVLRSSRDDDNPDAAGIFYAQSWALVHMLCLAQDYREKTLRFVERITSGEGVYRAFEAAYEKTLDQVLSDLRNYLDRPLRKIAVASPDFEEMAFSDVNAVTGVEALTWQAELLLLMGKDSAASRLYQEAKWKYRTDPRTHTGLAMLKLRARGFDAAREQFEDAIALGANDANTFFEYAMLLRETKAPPEKVTEYLLKTVGLNPDHAEAQFLLALRASQAEDFSGAVDRLLKATAILPRQSSFWHALSYAYHKLGRVEDSRTAARKALNAASGTQEEEMARAALALGDDKPLVVTSKPPITTPSSWKGLQGDSRIEGQLVAVDCGEFARLKVRSVNGEKTLIVKRPNSVALKGKGSPRLEFSCGPQNAISVIIDYIADTSEITAIEFR